MKAVYNLIQLLGVILLFWFPVGTIIGLILIILGGVQIRAIPKTVECPKCKEDIVKGAELCKHCGSELKAEEQEPKRQSDKYDAPF